MTKDEAERIVIKYLGTRFQLFPGYGSTKGGDYKAHAIAHRGVVDCSPDHLDDTIGWIHHFGPSWEDCIKHLEMHLKAVRSEGWPNLTCEIPVETADHALTIAKTFLGFDAWVEKDPRIKPNACRVGRHEVDPQTGKVIKAVVGLGANWNLALLDADRILHLRAGKKLYN